MDALIHQDRIRPGPASALCTPPAPVRRALVLVHPHQLQDDWVERLSASLGIEPKSIGRIGGREPVDRPARRRDHPEPGPKGVVDDRIADYGHVIMDECHHLSAHSFEQVVRSSPVSSCDSAPMTNSVVVSGSRSPSSVASMKYARPGRSRPVRRCLSVTARTLSPETSAAMGTCSRSSWSLSRADQRGQQLVQHGEGDTRLVTEPGHAPVPGVETAGVARRCRQLRSAAGSTRARRRGTQIAAVHPKLSIPTRASRRDGLRGASCPPRPARSPAAHPPSPLPVRPCPQSVRRADGRLGGPPVAYRRGDAESSESEKHAAREGHAQEYVPGRSARQYWQGLPESGRQPGPSRWPV